MISGTAPILIFCRDIFKEYNIHLIKVRFDALADLTPTAFSTSQPLNDAERIVRRILTASVVQW